ncbi:hypothetical protein XA68_16701 [Ophiocordyceps unilateralis]|uniref:chitinase n=1 Tax=Ophiocordyceps unilateralis TaxID=268505 RepID=A0A2A9P5T0_OPHUN|nr:hypothetical protein XA68_16701 [Ophiocordyceps unilateralis]
MALASGAAYGALNGYWGQSSGPDLRTFCDSGIHYATLGFVNLAPENDRSSAAFPGINFSSHCWAGAFTGKSGDATQLLSHCESIKNDIPYCQAKGVKVILSIGGEYRKPKDAADISSDYKVTSPDNGEHFADFLYGAFGPFSEHWKGPRPFDDGPDKHVAVDGFDFDIEAMFDNEPYIAMIDKFRALDSKILITGAPQCPTNPQYFQMQGMIQKAAFDALFIQFYNNPVCDAIANNAAGDQFNLDDWVRTLAQSEKSKDAKLFVGLPASPSAAGSGYIGPAEVKKLVCKHKDTKNFGGISLWDMKDAVDNVSEGKTFLRHVLDALESGCGPAVPSTAGYASASSSQSTSSTGIISVPSTAGYASASSSQSTSSTGIISVPSTAGYASASSSQSTCNTAIISVSSTVGYASASSSESRSRTGIVSAPLTTSTVYSTTVVTETVPLYTTVCPVATQTGSSSSSLEAEPSSQAGASETTTSSARGSLYTVETQAMTAYSSGAVDCPEETVTEVVTRSVIQTSTVIQDQTTEMSKPPASYATPKSTTTTEMQDAIYAAAVPSSTLERLTRPSSTTTNSTDASCPGCQAPRESGCRNCSSAVSMTAGPFRPMVSVPVFAAGSSRLAMSLVGLVVVAALQVLAA